MGHQHNTGHKGVIPNQDAVEDTRLGENKMQDVTKIWELAKQLGATGAADQGRMVEKIMTMEDRDRKEVERLGNKSHNP